MEDRHIVAIDLGSYKVALAVARINGDDIQLIYYREAKSAGIRNSYVYNSMQAARPLKELVEDAEKELNIRITQAVVGMPTYRVRQETKQAQMELNPEECITEADVESLKTSALESYPLDNPKTEELFGAVAQSFSTGEDFQLVENDIIGMAPEKLTCNFKVFIGQKKYVKDMRLAFHNAGNLHIRREYFTPDAIAKAVLYDFELDSGVALVDIGAGVTSVSIYLGNIMRYYAAIPFGGSSITSDIRTECYITEPLAENIKLAYGACIPEKLMSMSDKTLLINSNDTLPAKQVTVKYLSEIITARATEIIEAILYRIQESGLADRLRSGIVITGGGAGLLNIGNLIKDLSGYNVRTGYPKHIFSAPDKSAGGAHDTSATACIGMILMAKTEKIDCPSEENAPDRTGKAAAYDNHTMETDSRINSIKDDPVAEPSLDKNDGALFPDNGDGIIRPAKRPSRQKAGKEKQGSQGGGKWTLFSKIKELANEITDESI